MSDSLERPAYSSTAHEPDSPLTATPWSHLRRHTPARIALERAGGSLPTRALLAFNFDQALARDAVHAIFDADAMIDELHALPGNPTVLRLDSAATDRTAYLQRPDLGRKLSSAAAIKLAEFNAQTFPAPADGLFQPGKSPSISIMVSDGLSALAAQAHAVAVLRELLPRLHDDGISTAPLVVIRFGRVGIIDEVGAALGATLALILLGERPGLGAPDSLSAYFTFHPAATNTDANRNCVSNIRDAGIPPVEAARKLAAWLTNALTEKQSGVRLKEPPSFALTTPNSAKLRT